MPNTPPTLMAAGDILPSRFVKLTGDHKAQQAGDNDVVIGVAQEGGNRPPLSDLVTTVKAAESGQTFQLYGDGDVCLVEAGAAIQPGDRLKSDANGRAVPIATTGTTIQNIGAIALEAASAAGELVRCQVKIYSERPALV